MFSAGLPRRTDRLVCFSDPGPAVGQICMRLGENGPGAALALLLCFGNRLSRTEGIKEEELSTSGFLRRTDDYGN